MTDIKLSVIVVCLNSPDMRRACLEALEAQLDANHAEILAVGHWGEANGQPGQDRFSNVKWLSVPPETTIPQMRTHAIRQSCGEIVALLEDDCVISNGWIRQIVQSQSGTDQIVGGAIAPGNYEHLLDWANYFCEYGRFMPPLAGPQNALPGNNVTYNKNVLPVFAPGEGFYEVFFHDAWLRAGKKLLADPNRVVTNVNHWSVRHMTDVPFHHGRAFAGMRAQEFRVWRKGAYTVLSLALPFLKAARLAAVVFSRSQYRMKFVLSLPWTMLFLGSWSLGELVGYAAGPGRSAAQWR